MCINCNTPIKRGHDKYYCSNKCVKETIDFYERQLVNRKVYR